MQPAFVPTAKSAKNENPHGDLHSYIIHKTEQRKNRTGLGTQELNEFHYGDWWKAIAIGILGSTNIQKGGIAHETPSIKKSKI